MVCRSSTRTKETLLCCGKRSCRSACCAATRQLSGNRSTKIAHCGLPTFRMVASKSVPARVNGCVYSSIFGQPHVHFKEKFIAPTATASRRSFLPAPVSTEMCGGETTPFKSPNAAAQRVPLPEISASPPSELNKRVRALHLAARPTSIHRRRYQWFACRCGGRSRLSRSSGLRLSKSAGNRCRHRAAL